MATIKPADSLADRLREVLTDGKWVAGTNFKKEIIDLDWNEAAKKIDPLNSIADLTFHINYYIAGVSRVLEGGALDIRDKYSFDLPVVTSARDWKKMVDKFCSDAGRFVKLVEQLPEGKLSETFVDEKYGSYQRNIDAMIEHVYYHLGQVVLIKRLIQNPDQ